jgi:hypothetical protein
MALQTDIEYCASFCFVKFEIVKDLYFIGCINYEETANHRICTIKALYSQPSQPSVEFFEDRLLVVKQRRRVKLAIASSSRCQNSKFEVNLRRQSVGQSVLVSGAHLGPATNFSFS